MNRHRLRDWGDPESHDRAMNDNAVACQLIDRTSGRQLWIITDDIATTSTITAVLGPSDY